MVKHLRHFWTVIKRLVLISTIALMALGFWLHGGERSLAFAKPWIERAVNSADAPYVIAIGGVSIDWSNVAMLGKLRITQVSFAKRDGNIFAQMPALYATIDPIGFLPGRRLLHNVILQKPRLFATRNAERLVELGFDDAPSRMPLSDLTAFFIATDNAQSAMKPTSLPFKNLVIEDAVFTFTDENSGTKIVSNAFDFNIRRRHGAYEAAMTMPFTVDEQPVKFSAALRAQPRTDEHVFTIQLSQVPSKLLCLFDTCPDKVALEGPLSGAVAVKQ